MDQTGTSGLVVVVGVLLAGLLTWAVMWLNPAQETAAVAKVSSSSINYTALEHGANIAELERGRVYFAQLCVDCHGVRGDGYGEWAYRISPRPRDLTGERVQSKTDEYIFKVVSNGMVGTSMLGQKHRLSERQRWQVVLYLRHLASNGVGEKQRSL